MRLFKVMKDGGPLAHVRGLFVIEWKRAFSIVLLKFLDGSRVPYHTRAFNAISWVLKGKLVEHIVLEKLKHGGLLIGVRHHTPSLWPIYTSRGCSHKVESVGTTLVLAFRGPWRGVTLTHGRKRVG